MGPRSVTGSAPSERKRKSVRPRCSSAPQIWRIETDCEGTEETGQRKPSSNEGIKLHGRWLISPIAEQQRRVDLITRPPTPSPAACLSGDTSPGRQGREAFLVKT